MLLRAAHRRRHHHSAHGARAGRLAAGGAAVRARRRSPGRWARPPRSSPPPRRGCGWATRLACSRRGRSPRTCSARIGGIAAAAFGIRHRSFSAPRSTSTAAVLAILFIREPRPERSAAEEPGAGLPRQRPKGAAGSSATCGSCWRNGRSCVMLALLFCLWLSTTFVRPVMPLSIDQFSESHDGGRHASTSRLPGGRSTPGRRRRPVWSSASLG